MSIAPSRNGLYWLTDWLLELHFSKGRIIIINKARYSHNVLRLAMRCIHERFEQTTIRKWRKHYILHAFKHEYQLNRQQTQNGFKYSAICTLGTRGYYSSKPHKGHKLRSPKVRLDFWSRTWIHYQRFSSLGE